jgi:predicted ATPase
MRIFALEVYNFRGIKECKLAIPNKRVLCFVGAGDSTKSTLLEAIRLNLLQSWTINATDADFYQCNTDKPIVIRCTYDEFPDALIAEDRFGYYMRSGSAVVGSFDAQQDDGQWNDEPHEGESCCLTVQLTVDSSLEPKWEVVCNRLPPKALSLNDRRKFLCNSIGADFNSDFSWGRYSILHKYADGKGELRSVYNEAFRAASKSISFDTLNTIAEAVTAAGRQYSVPLEGEINNQIVMKPMGFSTDVGLYDGKTPFSQRGLGSRRLMSIGLNVNATSGAALLLIDEVETGLEPYRVCELIGELKRSHKESGQVLITTHSSSAISELSADELIMVNSDNGVTTVHNIGHKEIPEVQGMIRGNPESLLAKRLIVCEGKTEVGIIRALNDYLMRTKGFHLAHKGVCPVNGAGGNRAIKLARHLHTCGYDVCVFMDSDVKADNDDKASLKKVGISIFDWQEGYSIEEQIFSDVDVTIAEELLAIVVDENNIEEKRKKLNCAYEVCNSVDGRLKLKDGLESEQKKYIGTVAKNVKSGKSTNETSWYKRIDHGETIGMVLFNSYGAIGETTKLKTTLKAITEWVIGR